MPDIVDRPSIVKDAPDVPHYHSTFPLKEVRLTTEQFGLVKPHLIFDDVSTDDLEYNPIYKTRSYTLRAPLMQDVHRKLSYVKVDLSAILPFNYEKFYTNPVIGDDVPKDTGCVVESGYYKLATAVKNCVDYGFSNLNGANNFTTSHLKYFLKALVFGESVFSRGSLLSSLGSHVANQLFIIETGSNKILEFDEFFDLMCNRLQTFFLNNSVGTMFVTLGSRNGLVRVSSYGDANDENIITFRDFLNEIRSTSDWDISYFGYASPVAIAADFGQSFSIRVNVDDSVPFNYARLCAYQLAVAEYMTNDKVDHIYSAELFRQYIGSLLRNIFSSNFPNVFTVNGITYQYDYFAGAYFTGVIDTVISLPSYLGNNNCFEYFVNIFGFKRSLRYKDYFVSSRTRPLAVGDVSVSVNNNSVSVIDVSRNIQVQRFLNAVNHAGRRLSNYIKTLFGADIAPDRHVPQWLADIDELVYTSEVENTGDAQQTNPNSVTAIFTGNSSSKLLHFYADLPGFIIGLTSYDIERAYCDTIDRSFFIQDRFDMFIPELQFVGDQPILAHELHCADSRAFGTAFGYQYRDMQYKLLYSVADGGFVKFLPGYGFIYRGGRFNDGNISPDFIRSKVSELDEFYLSLTGYSLGSYFHFISVIQNVITARRPMIANPKILE